MEGALTSLGAWDSAAALELGAALLKEPSYALSSLAYIVAAGFSRSAPVPYVVLVAGIGVGSVVQHGPDPSFADLAHDIPLAGILVFVAADAAAALTGNSRRWWWWAAPLAALVPTILIAPLAADLVQVGMAAIAIALMLARARTEPDARRRILLGIGLLAVGGSIGRLSEAGWPLHTPDAIIQGHDIWHLLSAAALVVLAPLVGRHRGSLRAEQLHGPSKAEEPRAASVTARRRSASNWATRSAPAS
ncbi:MAG TPA: hypothetical protein VFC82_00180 [Actinomycetaceae bacterium]|nr:hypothetical protein [Actinomycetaceae bacterium]